MPQILVRHKVNNYAAWKDVFDKFVDTRRASGEKSFHIMSPADDPNDLTLLFDWDTAENAKAFMESPELKNAMQKGGVAEEPQIQFLDKIASGTL